VARAAITARSRRAMRAMLVDEDMVLLCSLAYDKETKPSWEAGEVLLRIR
jgi:hypothetical protein